MEYWAIIKTGGEKEITDLKKCDICEKVVNADVTYELKLRNNDTRLTKVIDICFPCNNEKGITELLAGIPNRKWNQDSKKWEKISK